MVTESIDIARITSHMLAVHADNTKHIYCLQHSGSWCEQ